MTWVLLRGLMRETRHWGDFPTQFGQLANPREIAVLDFPGNGSLHDQSSATSVAEMVNSLRQQLRQQCISPPYRLLALSLGAMVAVAWGDLHPQEVDRMVLINTSLAPLNPFYQRLRPRNYPALINTMIFGSLSAREKLILRLTSKQALTTHAGQLLHDWTTYAQDCPVSRANILRQLLAAFSYRAPASMPNVPVLLLAGAKDDLVNPQCSVSLARRWNCPLAMHPTAGHDLPLDDGLWVVQQIAAWL